MGIRAGPQPTVQRPAKKVTESPPPHPPKPNPVELLVPEEEPARPPLPQVAHQTRVIHCQPSEAAG